DRPRAIPASGASTERNAGRSAGDPESEIEGASISKKLRRRQHPNVSFEIAAHQVQGAPVRAQIDPGEVGAGGRGEKLPGSLRPAVDQPDVPVVEVEEVAAVDPDRQVPPLRQALVGVGGERIEDDAAVLDE